MPYAAVNGQRIWFTDSGGDGPAVVLAHGFLMDCTMFDTQVAALTPRYRVITWDERGFGRTEFDGLAFTYWNSARDCVGLLDHLGIERAVVGGMSQGGFVSLRVALTFPERVRALVLIDTQAGAEDSEAVALYEGMLGAWQAVGPVDDLVNAVAAIIINDPAHNPTWIAKWRLRNRGQLVEAGRTLNSRDDITDLLGGIACPALIIHGSNDAAIPMAAAELLRDRIGGDTMLVPIDGAGHASNLTHAAIVNTALVAWLDGL